MFSAVTSIDLPGLQKIASGKVREVYADDAADPDTLLFVATDRTSAYDAVLANGIPGKGLILTQLSAYWFAVLAQKIPGGLPTHLVSLSPHPATLARLSAADRARLRGRCMRVRRLQMFPVEAIVRGYLAGSAWAEYAKSGTVHGEADKARIPAGMVKCQRLPAPIYTPSTKAADGDHDENISRAQAAALIGHAGHAARIEELALAAYSAAAAHAAERGLLIADTKFEFGLDTATGEVVLADEVLTPDSSRFWLAAQYVVGQEQPSLDKQFLRDWLVEQGLKGQAGVEMPQAIVKATAERYEDVFQRLTGQTIEEALKKLED